MNVSIRAPGVDHQGPTVVSKDAALQEILSIGLLLDDGEHPPLPNAVITIRTFCPEESVLLSEILSEVSALSMMNMIAPADPQDPEVAP